MSVATHQRERRRTSQGRRRRRRRLITKVSVTVFTVLFVGGLWVAIEAVTARNALYTARASTLDAQAALGDGDFLRARARIDTAATAASRAESRTSGPHWQLIRRAPFIGDDAGTARDVIEVVDAAASTAQQAMVVAGGVLTNEGELPEMTVDGRIELAPVRQLAQGLAALDLGPLRSSRDVLAASTARPWLGAITDAREEALEAAEAALTQLERARDATGLVTSLLGADEPRRYLVIVQNSGELRGTGGLIGFLAVLEVHDGVLALSDPEGVNPEAVVAGTDLVVRGRFLERDLIDDPVARPDEFAQRYDHISAGSFLASTNADPDLPTVAPVVLDLYEQRAGQRLDGLIAIDPLALQRIQQTIGPLELPEDVWSLAPELPHPIPPDQLAEVLLVGVYDALGGPTEERRAYQSGVAEASLSSLLVGEWEATAVAQAIADSVGGRHLQVFTRDDDAQAAVLRLGVGGALAPLHADDDLLAVSANNAAGNKIDVHVAHSLSATIRLEEPRVVDGQVRIRREQVSRMEIRNIVDVDARDAYIVTTIRPDRLAAATEGDVRPGLARTWLTQWLPADAELLAVAGVDGQAAPFSTGEIHGRLAVDHYLDVAAGGQGAFEVTSTATVAAHWDGSVLTYGLTVWRQGKGIVDHLDVTVRPPEGWQVLDTAFTGGGQPGSLGPALPGTLMETTVEDGAGRLRGSATADTRMIVRLTPTPD